MKNPPAWAPLLCTEDFKMGGGGCGGKKRFREEAEARACLLSPSMQVQEETPAAPPPRASPRTGSPLSRGAPHLLVAQSSAPPGQHPLIPDLQRKGVRIPVLGLLPSLPAFPVQ